MTIAWIGIIAPLNPSSQEWRGARVHLAVRHILRPVDARLQRTYLMLAKMVLSEEEEEKEFEGERKMLMMVWM